MDLTRYFLKLFSSIFSCLPLYQEGTTIGFTALDRGVYNREFTITVTKTVTLSFCKVGKSTEYSEMYPTDLLFSSFTFTDLQKSEFSLESQKVPGVVFMEIFGFVTIFG